MCACGVYYVCVCDCVPSCVFVYACGCLCEQEKVDFLRAFRFLQHIVSLETCAVDIVSYPPDHCCVAEAHVMAPNLAQGAGLAMEDALQVRVNAQGERHRFLR